MLDICVFFAQFALGFLVWGILGHTFFMPVLKTMTRQRGLLLLLAPHAFRFLALSTFEDAYYNPNLSMEWARSSTVADVATALTAIMALIALLRRMRLANAFVWICNLIGLYAFAVTAGKMIPLHVAVHLLNAAWFGAVFWIPALMWSHILITRELLGKRSLTAG